VARKKQAKKKPALIAITAPEKEDKGSSKMYLINIGDSLVSFAKKIADQELHERISKPN